jgi:hypothetical protein
MVPAIPSGRKSLAVTIMKKTTHRLLKAVLVTTSVIVAASQAVQAQSVPVFTNLWKKASGSEYDLTVTGNNNRGVAINPITGNILYTSVVGGSNHVSVLNGADGTYLHSLDASGISGGTIAIIGVRVADDGAVYAVNLAGLNSTLKVYRWESEDDPNPPVNVYNFSPSPVRLGDTIDLRGAGTNTQIIAAGSATSNPGNQWVLINPDPSDPTLTNSPWLATFFTFPSGVAAGDLGNGICFEGTKDAIYGKKSGGTMIHHIGFDLVNTTNWLIESIDSGQNRLVGINYLETNGVKLLSGTMYGSGTSVSATEHRARVYNLTTLPPAIALDDTLPGPYSANGNAIGASDILSGRVASIEPNCGIAVYGVSLSATVPPSISSQPTGNSNILAGGYWSMKVSASGTEPLKYQWYLNGSAVIGATTSSILLSDLNSATVGNYTVVVTNNYGAATSAPPAYVGILPSVRSSAMTTLWTRKPGESFYLTTDNTQRGLAFNPVTGHLLVVSRAPSNGVHVVDAATGTYLHSLDMTGTDLPAGATYAVNMIGIAGDGAIYVCDLTTGGPGFTIFRWQDENASTQPTIAFQGDPGIGRIGDTFSAVGSGAGTLLVAASRSGTQVAVFNTSDGQSFNPTTVDVTDAPAGFAGLGLYATSANEFWGKSSSFLLRRVTFDLAAGTNGVTATLDAGSGTLNAIVVDTANQLVAGLVSSQTPHNVSIYDIYGMIGTNDVPVLFDQEWFGALNENINGTGQLGLDFASGRIFALDTNNGLLALKYAPPLRHEVLNGKLVMSWSGPAKLVSSSSVEGPYTQVANGNSPYTNTAPGPIFYRLQN